MLITRNIDLSIAAVIGLSAYMAASMVQAYPGLDIVVGLATGIGKPLHLRPCLAAMAARRMADSLLPPTTPPKRTPPKDLDPQVLMR